LNKKELSKYIRWAGGPSEVSRKLGLSRTTIWRWYNFGFPDTDFSGRTSYAKELATMCFNNGHEIDGDKILKSGRP